MELLGEGARSVYTQTAPIMLTSNVFMMTAMNQTSSQVQTSSTLTLIRSRNKIKSHFRIYTTQNNLKQD